MFDNFTSHYNNRKKPIAKAYITDKELGIDDDLRRAIQKEVTGKESAARISVAELVRRYGLTERQVWAVLGRG